MKLVEWQNPMEKPMEGAKDMTLNNVDALFQSLELTKQFNFGEDLSEEEKSELRKNAIRIPSELFGSFHSCPRFIYDCAKQWYSVYMDYRGREVYSVDIKNLDDAYRRFLGETEERYETRKHFFQIGKATISDPLKQKNWENYVFETHYLDQVGWTLELLEMINKDEKDWSKINNVYYEISDWACLLPFRWYKRILMSFSNDPSEVENNLVNPYDTEG